MAMTGFTSGVANVSVLVPVNPPARRISSPITLGDVVTVPPTNEVFGAQMFDWPLSTEAITSPEYETPTPPSVPAAEPGLPLVAAVQSVQVVAAKPAVEHKLLMISAPPSSKAR